MHSPIRVLITSMVILLIYHSHAVAFRAKTRHVSQVSTTLSSSLKSKDTPQMNANGKYICWFTGCDKTFDLIDQRDQHMVSLKKVLQHEDPKGYARALNNERPLRRYRVIRERVKPEGFDDGNGLTTFDSITPRNHYPFIYPCPLCGLGIGEVKVVDRGVNWRKEGFRWQYEVEELQKVADIFPESLTLGQIPTYTSHMGLIQHTFSSHLFPALNRSQMKQAIFTPAELKQQTQNLSVLSMKEGHNLHGVLLTIPEVLGTHFLGAPLKKGGVAIKDPFAVKQGLMKFESKVPAP